MLAEVQRELTAIRIEAAGGASTGVGDCCRAVRARRRDAAGAVLGHSNLATTQIYAEADRERMGTVAKHLAMRGQQF